MTTDCTRLDAYRDGRLAEPDAQAFESHAATCAACDDALLADDLGLSTLADVACPPAVLDAALAAARRPARHAADRGPIPASRSRRTPRRLRVVPLALAAGLALAATLWLLPSQEDASPEFASLDAPAQDTAPAPPPPSPEVEILDAEAPPRPPTPSPAPPAVRPRPPVTTPAPAAPSPEMIAAATPATEPDPLDEPEPSPEDIAGARRDLALAFALLADAQSQARDAIRDDASALTSTLDTALPF